MIDLMRQIIDLEMKKFGKRTSKTLKEIIISFKLTLKITAPSLKYQYIQDFPRAQIQV